MTTGDFEKRLSSLARHWGLKPRPNSQKAANKALTNAKKRAAKAFNAFHSELRDLKKTAKDGEALVDPWSVVEELHKEFDGEHFRPFEDILTQELLHGSGDSLAGTLKPNADVEKLFQQRGVEEIELRSRSFRRIRKALLSRLFNVGAELTNTLYRDFPNNPAERIRLRQSFRKHLAYMRENLKLVPPPYASETALSGLKASIAAAYQHRLREAEDDFKEHKAQSVQAKVQSHRCEARYVVPLFRDGQRVLRGDVLPTYLDTKAHRVDKMINGVATVVDRKGDVWLQCRAFEDGGTFPFEKSWMFVSKELKKQVKNAEFLKTAEDGETSQRAQPVKQMCFVDQIALTQAAQKNLQLTQRLELSHRSRNIKYTLTRFVTLMRGADFDENELSIEAFDVVANDTVRQIFSDWLKKDESRQISVHVDASGLVYVVVTLHGPDSVTTTMPREEVNTARLIALWMVAIIDRAVNGEGMQRSYPNLLNAIDETGSPNIEIPDQCVWPLQVTLNTPAEIAQPEPAADLAVVFAPAPATVKAKASRDAHGRFIKTPQSATGDLAGWDIAPVENWMFGWDQVPCEKEPIQELLAERFHIATQKQLQTMQIPLDGFWAAREGLTSADALKRLRRWFANSCVALCLIWFAGLIATIYVPQQFSERELWVFSLAFVLIALWRFLLIAMLVSMGRAQSDHSRAARYWRSFCRTVINSSFSFRGLLTAGPVLLAVFFGAIAWTEETADFLDAFSALFPDDLGKNEWSFQGALRKAVWALPIAGVGLLRQSYVTLSQLLIERGQIQERLRKLDGLEDNWKAGTEFLVAVEQQASKLLAKQIELTRERLKAKYEKTDRHFGAQSVTNGALVGLFALLGPLNGIAPQTGYDADSEIEMLGDILAQEEVAESSGGVQPPTRLASLGTASNFVTKPQLVANDLPCHGVNNALLKQKSNPDKSFIHHALLTATLMDCLEKKNRAQLDTITQLHSTMEQRHEKLINVLNVAMSNLPRAQTVQNTYVCLFPFRRHCVQDSKVDISTEGLGQVAFDFKTFTDQLEAAQTALAAFKGQHTATLNAKTVGFDTAMKSVEAQLAKFATRHGAQLEIDTRYALADLNEIITKLENIKAASKFGVTAETRSADDALNLVLRKLKSLQRADTVTLQANAEQVFHEIALARRLVESFPKQRRISLLGLLRRPFVNLSFPINLAQAGNDWPTLASCDFLGARRFASNAPLSLNDGGPWDSWSLKGVTQPLSREAAETQMALLLENLQTDKTVYILGTADLQGSSSYNFRLAQARADLVSKAIDKLNSNFTPIALNLGEAGWLTWRGLPGAEEDASHRAALVYACDAPEKTPGVMFGR